MNNAKNLKISQLTTFSVKGLDGRFLGKIKVGDKLHIMRTSNQKIAC
jgi:hypothetical protein